jgi:hypothetical protein
MSRQCNLLQLPPNASCHDMSPVGHLAGIGQLRAVRPQRAAGWRMRERVEQGCIGRGWHTAAHDINQHECYISAHFVNMENNGDVSVTS